MEHLHMHSLNKIDENISKIAALFPNCVTEAKDDNGEIVHKIDFDILKQELSNTLVEGREERYQFTWPDKKQAILTANAPINKTLRPCREESVNFDSTENLYIEGDNLEVLKLLQETYLGKIKMIYIDPPYNTGNDFVYEDDFAQDAADYIANSGQTDEEGNRLVANTESNGRFHTDWLNMMYPRLKLARDLLRDDGFILISIDDNEIENLRKVCDEIFGLINRLGTFVINSTPNARDYGHIGKMHEFCLFYAKEATNTETNMLPELNKEFKYKDKKGGYNIHPLYNSNEAFHKGNRPNLYYPFYVYKNEKLGDGFYKIGLDEKPNSVKIYPPLSQKNKVQFVWRWGKEKALENMNEEIIGYEVTPGEFRIVQKMRHSEKIIRSLLIDTKYSSRRGTAEVEELMEGKIFSFPKPLSLLYDFCKIGLNDNDIILDFFSGSATTAHAVMQLNAEDGGKRKFIMVQLPEVTDEKSEAYKAGYKNICEIGKERIRRAGQQILKQVQNDKDSLFADEKKKLDIGFRVLKCDTSNMEDVYYTPDHIDTNNLFKNNIKSDRTGEDLLFQTMLDLGIMLSSKIETKKINGKEVFCVEDNYLMACFDDSVDEKTITEIAKEKPYYFVMRDPANSKDGDSLITNFEQIFTTYSPDTVRKVL
ncbi:MAG: site-specific DNA-methyltransferase [Spirochaetia bacterium]|nr:site-specific DNA-methyltransferase [Spirochaetia bacterium]